MENAEQQQQPATEQEPQQVTEQDPQVQELAEQMEDLNVSHPLENEWTFWYDKRLGAGARVKGERDRYESNLKPIGSFATVEDFWRHYNYMAKPSQLDNNANYHLFKKGVKPLWEDPVNSKGGKWIIQTKKNHRLCDQHWENLVLGMIGETIEEHDEIAGAVVSRRKTGDKIALWLSSTDEAIILAAGKRMKENLNLGPGDEIAYQIHADALKSGASYRNLNKYTL